MQYTTKVFPNSAVFSASTIWMRGCGVPGVGLQQYHVITSIHGAYDM